MQSSMFCFCSRSEVVRHLLKQVVFAKLSFIFFSQIYSSELSHIMGTWKKFYENFENIFLKLQRF